MPIAPHLCTVAVMPSPCLSASGRRDATPALGFVTKFVGVFRPANLPEKTASPAGQSPVRWICPTRAGTVDTEAVMES